MVEDDQGNIWIGLFGGGLWKHSGNATTRFYDKTAGQPFPMISKLKIYDNQLWIATAGGGCVCLDLQNKRFKEIRQCPGFMKLHGLLKTAAGEYLIGSVGSGTAILDESTEPPQWKPISSRTLSHLAWVNHLGEWQGKLWLATTNGIYSTDSVALATNWKPVSAGLSEGINHFCSHGGKLYLATASRGVFYMKPGKQPVPVRNTYGEIHFITIFKNRVIAGGRYGLWEISDDNVAREITNFPQLVAKSALVTRKNFLMIGADNGVILITNNLRDFETFLKIREFEFEETSKNAH
ncbi:MAG: hypothetical protein Kow0029_20610 [Candidatus Rifleibacteriota bacterium]